MPRGFVAVFATLVGLASGCGDDISPDPEPDAAQASLAERLLGSWTKPGTYVQFRDDGRVFSGTQASALLAPEAFAFENETFVAQGAGSCPFPVEVEFTFEDDDTFTAVFVDDPCPDRAASSDGRSHARAFGRPSRSRSSAAMSQSSCNTA